VSDHSLRWRLAPASSRKILRVRTLRLRTWHDRRHPKKQRQVPQSVLAKNGGVGSKGVAPRPLPPGGRSGRPGRPERPAEAGRTATGPGRFGPRGEPQRASIPFRDGRQSPAWPRDAAGAGLPTLPVQGSGAFSGTRAAARPAAAMRLGAGARRSAGSEAIEDWARLEVQGMTNSVWRALLLAGGCTSLRDERFPRGGISESHGGGNASACPDRTRGREWRTVA